MEAMIPRPQTRNGGLAARLIPERPIAAQLRDLAARFARAMLSLSLEKVRAQGTPGAQSTRSLVCKV
jgi:hypothetical protein